jgi:NAD+ synthase
VSILETSPLLRIDAASEVDNICGSLRRQVGSQLKRRGVVLGLSGGIDSSVCAALAARALGPTRVMGILMPEKESSDDSRSLAELLAAQLNIRTIVEDITPLLDAAGCYRRRDDAIRSVIPAYDASYKNKIVLPGLKESAYNVFSVVVESPSGVQSKARLTADAYLAIVAATNFKQRIRKAMEYHYADRFHFAVIGTPNRLEYDQGFFVKNGDGSADLKPIAHLYKSQVYQLAEYLGVPDVIRRRPPTTDTYTLAQSQDEFYFSVPMEQLDVCLFGFNAGMTADEVAPHAGLTPAEVSRVYEDIQKKRATTRYLHQPPLLITNVPLD